MEKNGEILRYKVLGLAVPVPREQPSTEKRLMNWERFGSDNLFPQALSILNRRSPMHKSIMNYKRTFITGEGYTTENAQLEEYIKRVNNNNESLRLVVSKLIKDDVAYGNSYLEIVTDASGNFLNLFHKDTTKARVGAKDSEGNILFHPDWARVEGNKQFITDIAIYPETTEIDGNLHSVIHFKEYEPEYVHYGLPIWLAAMDAACIAYKTNRWNLSRIENSFQSPGIMIVQGDMSPEDALDMEKQFKDGLTGENKQGNVMFIIKKLGQDGTQETQFVPLETSFDGDWGKLHDQSNDELISAHGWFRSLTSMPDNTGFETDRIRTEYDMALASIIKNKQLFFLEQIRMVIEDILGIDASDLKSINNPPTSLADRINVDKVLTKRAALKILGEEVDEDREDLDEVIDTTPNVRITETTTRRLDG